MINDNDFVVDLAFGVVMQQTQKTTQANKQMRCADAQKIIDWATQ